LTLFPHPELPIDESQFVLVGEVIKEQPFLTTSRSGLNTLYTVRVLDTVRSEAKTPTTESVVVLRPGGKARLDTGRIIESQFHGLGDPLVLGQRYLLFLEYRQDLEAYMVVKLWHVTSGLVTTAYPTEKSENDGKSLAEVVSSLKAKAGKL
jgi:hypothetical protein